MFLINMKHLVVLIALIAVTSAQIKTAIMEDDNQYRAISFLADPDQDTIGKFLIMTVQKIVWKDTKCRVSGFSFLATPKTTF
jgi:hypothetical protein